MIEGVMAAYINEMNYEREVKLAMDYECKRIPLSNKPHQVERKPSVYSKKWGDVLA